MITRYWWTNDALEESPDGPYVYYDDHVAELARVRSEALEEATRVVPETVPKPDLPPGSSETDWIYGYASGCIAALRAIRTLIDKPAPQR